MNKKAVSLRNISIICICGCLLLGLFPFPPMVWRLLLIIISLYVILSQNPKRLLSCEKIGVFLSMIIMLYFVIGFILGQTNNFTGIGNVLCALLPIPLFKYLTEKSVLTDKVINILVVLLLVCSVFYYFEFQNIKFAQTGKEENVVINASGVFMAIIPLLFITKNNIIKFGVLLICSFFLIISVKRGNIIAAIVPVILLLYQHFKGTKRSIGKIALFIIFIVGFVFAIYNWVISNEFFLYRLEQTEAGDSSGRDIIYSRAWAIYNETDSVIHALFGYGYSATTRLLSSMAHSDWLEILLDYGAIGVMIYALLIVSTIHQVRYYKNSQEKLFLVSCIIVWILKSVYSMFIFDTNSFLMAMCIGIALGKRKINEGITNENTVIY